jgi:hypothetical protein
MPAFTLKGPLVYFAPFKKHIGFFPTSSGIAKFKKELSVYEGGKGSVQFPLDEPIPYGLITRIVKFRVKENLERAKAKTKKKQRTALEHKIATEQRDDPAQDVNMLRSIRRSCQNAHNRRYNKRVHIDSPKSGE